MVVETYDYYEGMAQRVLRYTTISCVAHAWGEHGKVHVKALCDFKGYKPVKWPSQMEVDDYAITKYIRDLLDECDFLIGWNGRGFDAKKIMSRVITHRLPPPSPFRIIDPKVEIKKIAGFDSNKLKEITKQLGNEDKIDLGGYSVHVACMEGDMKAWKKYKEYNIGDVVSLRQDHLTIRPYMKSHPNLAMFKEKTSCSKCGSSRGFTKGGFQYNQSTKYQIWRCVACRGCLRGARIDQPKPNFVSI